MLISDQAKDLVNWCFWRRGLYVSFSTLWFKSEILNKSAVVVEKSPMRRFLWRKREFYGVIWRCFARVKYESIMSGFRKCCDCRQIHLLCEKSQVYGWACVTRKLCDKHKKTKNASWVLSVGDFVLESLFCAQRLWILNLVFSAKA